MTAGSPGSSPSMPRPTGSRGSSLALRHRAAGSGGWRRRGRRSDSHDFLLRAWSRRAGAASGDDENPDEADREEGFHGFLPVLAGRPRLSARFVSKDGRSREGSLWVFLPVSWGFSGAGDEAEALGPSKVVAGEDGPRAMTIVLRHCGISRPPLPPCRSAIPVANQSVSRGA